MALVFPTEDSLCAALKAGLVPPDVQRAGVRVGRTTDGQLELQPDEAMSAIAKAALKNAGVVERAASAKASSAPCWAAALKPVYAGEPDTVPATVLFYLSDARQLLPLCGELLRLGCDRQELRMLDKHRALLRVREAPYFVVAKEELRVFAPAAGDRFWIQLGYHHPLSDSLERPASGTLLIHGDGSFETLEDGPFTPLDGLVFPTGLPDKEPHAHEEKPPRIAVTMRLLPSSRAEEPSLWLVREGPPAVEAWVKGAPEAALDGVLFAVAADLVVLKVRAGRERSVVALPGEPFVRVAELPNLFAPIGTSLEPPLSRERLREWLAPDPDELTWLERVDGKLERHGIAESAMKPLSEWVDYVIDTSAPALSAWVKSATFEFEQFEGRDAEPAREQDEGAPESAEPKAPRASPRRPMPPRTEPPKGPPTAPLTLPPQAAPAQVPALEQQLQREEAAFLALEAAPESPERVDAWGRLAGLYASLARDHESGLAFAHSLWELSDAQAAKSSAHWAQTAGSNLATLLRVETPSEAQTRAVVAQLYSLALAKDGAARSRLAEAQAWLDKHDDNLDVRSLWLGRVALSLLAGHDALGLARARDRVLTRLRRGLSLERDVPRFLRAAGPNSSRDNVRVERVVEQLNTLLKAFDETPRKRAPTEADWKYTRAYVGLTFAWGFARLGALSRARELETQALAALDVSKPFNAILTRAYSARIAQAAEGLAPTTPLGAGHATAVQALVNLDRYRFDTVRQHLVIIEPHEYFEPPAQSNNPGRAAMGFLARDKNTRTVEDETESLREIEDPSELARAIGERIDGSLGSDPEDVSRALAGLASSLPRLPEASGLQLLQRLIARADPLPAAAKSRVLESALQVAAHFGHSNLARQLVGAISGLIAELGAQAATRLTGLLVTGIRTLRRTGLKDEGSTLLSRAQSVIKGDTLEVMAARLAIAGGFAYLGRVDLMRPTVEEALGHLARETSPLFRPRSSDAPYLARHTARALAMAPPDIALPNLRRVAAPLPWLNDMYSTNDYLCVSVVELADILVVAHVGEELTLSEVTRTFLEEDEYRVRRRIHREAGG